MACVKRLFNKVVLYGASAHTVRIFIVAAQSIPMLAITIIRNDLFLSSVRDRTHWINCLT
jgi:hypothetical protein